jgi:predicted RNase H-like HicB family nuclease
MTKKMIPAIVWKEGDLFVAKSVGIELASQGKTQKEALNNLQEALDLYLEDERVSIPCSQVPQNLSIKQVYA